MAIHAGGDTPPGALAIAGAQPFGALAYQDLEFAAAVRRASALNPAVKYDRENRSFRRVRWPR